MTLWRRSGVLAAAAVGAVLSVGCTATGVAPHTCTEIGSPAGVSVTVVRDAVLPSMTLTLRICQAACVERRVELVPGSVTVGETCSPDGPDGSCSASSSPDGTMVGFVDLATLTAGPARISGQLQAGADRTELAEITTTAAATYPNGRDCPVGGPQAVVRVTISGLR
ncbi:MAG TPA: hypothetical protein VIT65_25530 [Microlunatus sp.]